MNHTLTHSNKTVTDESVQDQAAELECLLPRLMRKLFSLEPDHPVYDMPVAQLRICTILQSGPRTMSALSEEAGISVSAITQMGDRMERSGMVERNAGQDDRRIRELRLTAYGAEVMRSRRAYRVERMAAALERLSPAVRVTILESIRSLMKAGEANAPHLPDDPASDEGPRRERLLLR